MHRPACEAAIHDAPAAESAIQFNVTMFGGKRRLMWSVRSCDIIFKDKISVYFHVLTLVLAEGHSNATPPPKAKQPTSIVAFAS